MLACSIDTDLNYYKTYSKNVVDSINIEHKNSISRVFLTLYIQNFLETLAPESPAWLCPGGLTAPPRPPAAFDTCYARKVRTSCVQCSFYNDQSAAQKNFSVLFPVISWIPGIPQILNSLITVVFII